MNSLSVQGSGGSGAKTMGLIPEETISQILDRCDIAETIASYIPLKRAGRNFKAVCPFHHEKTPSFVVNPDKQIFHCFGCGIGGNVIVFVMNQERVEFPEAVRILADKAGIQIPANDSQNSETASLKELVYKVNDLTAQFYHGALVSSGNDVGHVIKYLKERGITLDTVKKFRLGFAADRWDSLLNFLRGKNIHIGLMEKAGLVIPKESRDGFYDRFRDRIIFPIFDVRSRSIGFGARAMKEGLAKYINSPETAVYTKGNHLYGFHASKDSVREKDFVIVVEGYMDFLIPYQAGVGNIVASLGTALTTEQIRLIRRYTQNVVMLFDADAAGENAMVRSLDLLVEEGMSVKVAQLSSGEDPDSFVRKFGAEKFNECIAQALPLFDYKLKILTGRFSHKTVEGKAKISAEMLSTISRFQNAVLKFGYVKQLAQALAVPEEALVIELQKANTALGKRPEPEKKTLQPVPVGVSAAERNLLKLMLEDVAFIPLIREELQVSDFMDDKIKKVIHQIFDAASQGKDIKASSITHTLDDKQIAQMVSELVASDEIIISNKAQVCRDCIQHIKSNRMKVMRQNLREQISTAERSGDKNRLDELKHQFNQLIKR